MSAIIRTMTASDMRVDFRRCEHHVYYLSRRTAQCRVRPLAIILLLKNVRNGDQLCPTLEALSD
jgi:hypothetical protein